MDDAIAFWSRVKDLIRAHKISQEKFASYIGMKYSTFKSWIYNNRIPDIFTGHDMAIALGVSMEYLVTGNDGQAAEIRSKQVLERKIAAREIKKMAKIIQKDARLIG